MSTSLKLRAVAITAVLTVMAACAFAPAALAERPQPLIDFPGDHALGSDAGHFDLPNAIAASPVTGDIYMVDDRNHRVSVFTPWGQFVRAFGWNVNASAPAEELQVCTAATGCKKGSEGTGTGQFGKRMVGGIAVDPAGNVYVGDLWNSRVQKFNSAGEFLLSFGSAGTGDGQFSTLTFGCYVAVSPDGAEVYVGDNERIQVFEPDGGFKAQFSFESLHEESPQFPESGSVKELVVDPESGDLYVAAVGLAEAPFSRIFRLDPGSGDLIGSITAPFLRNPTALAVDSDSNLYVVNELPLGFPPDYKEIMMFDSAGNKLLPTVEEEEEAKKIMEDEAEGRPTEPWEPFGMQSDDTGLFALAANGACGSESDDLYVAHYQQTQGLSYVQAYGPPPQDTVKCPPPAPLGPPEIAAQYATEVNTDSATLQAEINPRYALDATYYLEYGTGKCSEGGCTEEEPASPGQSLTTKVANAPVKSGGISLADLEPGTTYHYRFVAQSGAGGPVLGAEGSFTTFPPPPAPFTACANQAFRTGASAPLADCRAYELVSPAERSPAGDIVAGLNGLSYPAELNQSSLDGEKLAYSSEYAFADSLGAPSTSEYIATRIPGQEWTTHAISPPRESTLINTSPNIKLDIEEKAFTADLCRSWLMHDTDTPLAGGSPPGFPRLYRRENCGAGADSYAPLETIPPSGVDPESYWPELQGTSADGSAAVLRVNGRLTADAPDLSLHSGEVRQLYHASEDGPLRFVCRLPDGSVWTSACTAGTGDNGGGDTRVNHVENAVSANGERVYWSAGEADDRPGTIYLRENSGAEQSAMATGKCSEEDKACTYAVSTGTAQFWTAATDGSKALYTQGTVLREFDAETRKSKTIAQGALGVAGASEDLSRFYFASRKALGEEGTEGEPNLYLSEEGQTALVATLAEREASVATATQYFPVSPVAPRLIGRGARVTPDGDHLLFVSSASLTGYDNLDATSGNPVFELYLYEAGSEGPVCVSCNPSGVRPLGRLIGNFGEIGTPMAAKFATAPNQLYAPRVITADGSRVFFESFESLVARDANQAADVYEWQKAGGEAACEAAGADLYVPDSGGCLSLISSGQSDFDSTFLDSSEDGRDVFFKTDSSLVPQDHGLIDVYDAREGGGLPAPPAPNPGCQGEDCQSPPPPPGPATPPTSASFQGPGNVRQAAAPKPKPCPKGKRRVVRGGKVRCVKPPRKHR